MEIQKAVTTGTITEECAITIIIPTYNTAQYLPKALDSLIHQTFSETIEILCIDDESTDDTRSVLRNYEERYPMIRVIYDSHHGLGYQRNHGIRLANGKYLVYLDSDDSLTPDALEKMYRICEDNQLDLIFTEAKTEFETEEIENRFSHYRELFHRKECYTKVYNGKELYCELREHGDYFSQVGMQMVKKEYLKRKNIWFPEIEMLEDEQYTFHVTRKADRVMVLPDALYLRYMRNNSLITSHGHERLRINGLLTILRDLRMEVRASDNSQLNRVTMQHILRFQKQLLNLIEIDAYKEILTENDWRLLNEIDLLACFILRKHSDQPVSLKFDLSNAHADKTIELRRFGDGEHYGVAFCVTSGNKTEYYKVFDEQGRWQMHNATRILSDIMDNSALHKVELRKCGKTGEETMAFVTWREDRVHYDTIVNSDGTKNWVSPDELKKRDIMIEELKKEVKELSRKLESIQNAIER